MEHIGCFLFLFLILNGSLSVYPALANKPGRPVPMDYGEQAFSPGALLNRQSLDPSRRIDVLHKAKNILWLPDKFHPAAIAGLGVTVGFLSGVVGIGGGPLIAPILIMCAVAVENAFATSNIVTCVVALVNTIAFQKTHPHTIDVQSVVFLTLGSMLGVTTAKKLNFKPETLKLFLIVAVGLISLNYFPTPLKGLHVPGVDHFFALLRSHTIALLASQLCVGAIIGFISVLVGVGGGVLLVPALNLVFDLSLAMSSATSLAAIVFISGQSAVARWKKIAWPVAFSLFTYGALGSWLGFLAYRWAPQVLNKQRVQILFGCSLVLSCALLLFTVLPAWRAKRALAKAA